MTVKVGINGYGTVGKRVADAVAQQDDMEIVGVAKRSPTYQAEMAVEKGFPFYAASDKYLDDFEKKDIPVEGMLEDLLEKADIIVDCTPKKAGYKPEYEKAGVKLYGKEGKLMNLQDFLSIPWQTTMSVLVPITSESFLAILPAY